MTHALAAILIFIGLSRAAAAAEFQCPPGEKVAWGITTATPKNKADLDRLSVTPPIYGTPDEWDLDPVSNHGKRKLYLSCVYKGKTPFSKRLPIKAQKCHTLNYNQDLSVQCIPRHAVAPAQAPDRVE